jgi:PAS domain S-box-containing protein
LNDLARVTALPVLSTGGEPSQIGSALLDLLIGMLPLSFAFIRLSDPKEGPSVEMVRVAEPFGDSTCAHEIGQALEALLGDASIKWPPRARVSIGDVEFCIASSGLGLQEELGVVVAGSPKLDFPEQTEAFLLHVAANQATIALQQARLLTAQRTRELATPKDESERSERESWRIIDSIPGPIALLKKSGDVDMVNRRLLEYFGTTIDKAMQWGTNELVHPEDLPHVLGGFTRSVESGTPYENEYRLRRWDGVYRWFQGRAFALRDANGQIVRWCVLLTDIDDRKRAEDAVRASERNLQLIIDTIPAMAWSARADGSADFFSQHYLDYVGLSLEQAKDWGWTAAIHPEDLEALVATWKRLTASEQAGEAEARLRRFDGAYRWFLFRASPLRDESGKIVKWYGANLDIEDRKRGEEDLRARELSWRQIVDNIPGLVATTGGMGEVEFLNRQTLEYFGKTSEELKDWALIDSVHPDDLPRVVQARIKSIETGQIYDVEHRCRRADGIYRWFQVRGLPVRNAEGTITAWYLLLTDIDDRKKAEDSLQSSERNLNLMINAIPTIIGVLRTDGSVLYGNHAASRYTGLSLEELQREDFRARVVHPEDEERLGEKRRLALTRAVPFEIEQRCLGKDGRYRWFLFRYNPVLDEQGKIDRWYVASFDIEDRKRAEAELRRAYNSFADAQRLSKTGSFITDLVGDDHNWSEEAYRIFEFDPATKVTLERIRNIIHPDDLQAFEDTIARAMTGVHVNFAFRILTGRGAVKHVRGMAHVVEQVEGRPMFVGALQDVTESKLAEEALSKTRFELAHVARVATLNAFTASIAHEVNQPLSGIITNAGTCLRMLDGDPPNVDGARETVRRTLRDGNRAADVIKRLRALYSKKEFTLEPVDLNEATREVIALSLSDLQRNRVIVRSELFDDLPPVTCDRVQVQQVILNLIRNATDAMVGVEDRPRQLLIRTEQEHGDCVRVTVRDAGVGLDHESLQKLFDAFYTTKSGGMGIGLSVSRSIIERHHGRLWAEPNDGPGATFSFSIPFGAESVVDAALTGRNS